MRDLLAWMLVAVLVAGCTEATTQDRPVAVTDRTWRDPSFEIVQASVHTDGQQLFVSVDVRSVDGTSWDLPANHTVVWTWFDARGEPIEEGPGPFRLPGRGVHWFGAELRNATGALEGRALAAYARHAEPVHDELDCGPLASEVTPCPRLVIEDVGPGAYIEVHCDIEESQDDIAGVVSIVAPGGQVQNAMETPHPYGGGVVECFVGADASPPGTWTVAWQPEDIAVDATVHVAATVRYVAPREAPEPLQIWQAA